jgi:uncharacterized protein YkwD
MKKASKQLNSDKKRLSDEDEIKKRKTDPNNLDTDEDGLSDEDEVNKYKTDPNNPDTDGDGLSDGDEVNKYKTDPNNPDTDGDGLSDGDEIQLGLDPLSFWDYVVPNENNNYRPKALQPKRLLFYAVSIIVIKLITILATSLTPLTALLSPDYYSAESRKVISLTNKIRKDLNIQELTENTKLTQAAMWKVEDMMINQYFAHMGPDGKRVADWLKLANYNFKFGGENLAIGFQTAEEIVNAWKNSPTHYKNMIDPDFQDIGVGISAGKYKEYDATFAAQYFGTENVAKTIQTQTPEETVETPLETIETTETSTSTTGSKKELVLSNTVTSTENQSSTTTEKQENNNTNLQTTQNDNNKNVLAEKQTQTTETQTDTQTTSTENIILDTTAPQITDTEKTKIFITKDSLNNYVISAEIYLTDDTKNASIYIEGTEIQLVKDENIPNKWSGHLLTDQESFFQPVVPVSLKATDDFGNELITDIDWDDIILTKPSPINQYNFAKKHKSNSLLNSLFSISSIYYKILLILAITILLINIFVKIKKQHADIIISSILLIILLILLIIF